MHAFDDIYNFDQKICHFFANSQKFEISHFCVSTSKIYELPRLTLPYSKAFDQEFWTP